MWSSTEGVAAVDAIAPVRAALALIDGRLDERIRLEEIAHAAGMSPYYFARLFKRSIGLAPHQYVIRRRLERARQLLDTTRLPIAEVALAVGCASQSHFSALFHKTTGVTPLAYRLRREAGQVFDIRTLKCIARVVGRVPAGARRTRRTS
jgi:transcriptional regulator GlxA family with amidase domain